MIFKHFQNEQDEKETRDLQTKVKEKYVIKIDNFHNEKKFAVPKPV